MKLNEARCFEASFTFVGHSHLPIMSDGRMFSYADTHPTTVSRLPDKTRRALLCSYFP
jgi:predicted Zn-dependent protease